MIERTLPLSQARESIGLQRVHHRAVLEHQGSFSRNLRKLLERMDRDGASQSSIRRATSNLLHSWRNTEVPLAIENSAKNLQGVSYDPLLLKHHAFEMAQNGVEHGAKFASDVVIDTIGGDHGILVSILDSGPGIHDLEEKIASEKVLYPKPGYTMGRGYGLQGAKEDEEVLFGFHKEEDGFRVNILVTSKQIEEMARRRAQMLFALQNGR